MSDDLNHGMSAFGCVGPPWWDDKVVVLVGGGPSLQGVDFGRFYGPDRVVVGVNQSIFDLPGCDAGVSVDYAFAANLRNQDKLAASARSGSEIYLAIGRHWQSRIPRVAGAVYLREHAMPLSFDLGMLCREPTSGLAALNLAILKRAWRILLFGYDYRIVEGRHHYHGSYPWHVPIDQNWLAWARYYRPVADICRCRGIAVVNASPESRIDCFLKCSTEDALSCGSRSLFKGCMASGTTFTSEL